MTSLRLFGSALALFAAPLSIQAQPVGPPAPGPAVGTPVGVGAPVTPPVSTVVAPGDPSAVGPLEPRGGDARCSPGTNRNGEIVVCGRGTGENSSFRVPQQFRGIPTNNDADASLAARTRDMDSIEQFANQTSGPSAYLNRSRQQRCEWVAERQIAQGRRPDCTRRNRQNEAADYTRGIPQSRD